MIPDPLPRATAILWQRAPPIPEPFAANPRNPNPAALPLEIRLSCRYLDACAEARARMVREEACSHVSKSWETGIMQHFFTAYELANAYVTLRDSEEMTKCKLETTVTVRLARR